MVDSLGGETFSNQRKESDIAKRSVNSPKIARRPKANSKRGEAKAKLSQAEGAVVTGQELGEGMRFKEQWQEEGNTNRLRKTREGGKAPP
jgi:Rieske Fe-S protein